MMNIDGPNTSRISHRSLEEIEENPLTGTLENIEDVLVSKRAKILPDHIVDLMNNQRNKHAERDETPNGSLDVSCTSTDTLQEKYLLRPPDSQNWKLRKTVELLHEDKEFLVAAEIGNSRMLRILISRGVDVQQKDHLGRTALHLAVCAESEQAIVILLDVGVFPNVKDNVGMTPLSLSLMRRPSLKVANLLFNHGTKLLPRTSPMDTGLFLQFVMMCTPTEEEAKVLKLLTKKGALINDPEAPGGRQALHFAAMSDNCPLIQILVDLGADLLLVNHRNETPKEVAWTFKCKNAYMCLSMLELRISGSKFQVIQP